MAMSIFDLKAGLKTDTIISPAKQPTASTKNNEFRKVLENVQKIKQVENSSSRVETKPFEASVATESITDNSYPTKEPEAIQEKVVETVENSDETAEDKERSVIEETNPLIVPVVLTDAEQKVVSETLLHDKPMNVDTEAPFQLAISQEQLQALAPQQRGVIQEIQQLLSQLQQFMNGKLQLDEQQLQALFAKLMKFLQQNADWMEVNPNFKNKPIAEMIVVLNQLLEEPSEQSMETLQKIISKLQKNDNSTVDVAKSEAKAAIPTQEPKVSVNDAKVVTNAKMVEIAPEKPAEVATTNAATVKQAEVQAPTNQINQQPVTQQTTQVRPEQSQTFTPQQLPQEMQKMVKNFRFNRANGVSEARFALNPEQLGHINVKISVHNGNVVAQIYTDTAMAKETLEAQLLHLRAALQGSGLHVEKLEIFNNTMLSQQFHEQKRQQSSQQFSKQQKQKHLDSSELNVIKDESTDEVETLQVKMGTRIDVTA